MKHLEIWIVAAYLMILKNYYFFFFFTYDNVIFL